MSKTEVKKIIIRYANELKKKKFLIVSMYLFGSYAKNKANKWSDIDVAVISNKLKNSWGKDYERMIYTTLNIDNRIEPHGFTEADFKNLADPWVYEIRKTGIKVI